MLIFIAALTSINTELYEAAAIDGAGRLQRIWHITLPGIAVTIVLVATLNIANILNAAIKIIAPYPNSFQTSVPIIKP